MTNPIERAHQALVARLSQIVPANDYLTDAGTRIKEGWLEDLLSADDVAFPFIAIQPGEYPPPEAGAGVVKALIGRRLVAAVQPVEDYRAALDSLYVDLVRALQVPAGQKNPWGQDGPYSVVLGTSKAFPPGQGLAAGTLVFPLQLHVIIQGA